MVLLIDGNYILNRNVFSLAKDRLLYGNLEDSLRMTVNKYAKWYPFKKIHFISDSKSNWRKILYPEYKANRKSSEDIDWDFVYVTYDNFKSSLSKRYDILEENLLEGDDWISYLTKHYNKQGQSVLIVSNDGDIQQLLTDGKDYINIMVNENAMNNNVFINEGYKTWLYNFNLNIGLPSLFDDDQNEDSLEYEFIKELLYDRKIKEVKTDKVLFEKIVGGDRGDNIKSVHIKNNRGIGEKTAEKLYDKYVEYFGVPTFDDTCFDRMTDIVIEQRKLDSIDFKKIKDNILFNNKLVNLQKLPTNIINKIEEKYDTR